jgi:uncharacterized membrane protein YphA (DoxX/SURF4 family)
MNTFLWVLQILLAVVFLGAALAKLTQPREKLTRMPNMEWTEDFAPGQLKGIGTLELMAALGLILPGALDVAGILTPLAATGLVLVMVGAILTHRRRGEKQQIGVNIILLVLAVVVAIFRFGSYSF